jgi:RHS repeat-associated protein
MSFQVREKVTLLPAVPTVQNGSNTAHTLRTIYDDRGRVTWAKSPRGFITHFQFDDVTGAVTRRIDDVDTARISGVPGGWITPAGGGLHLISDFKVDAHGRVLRSLEPEHRIHLMENDTATTPVRRAEFRLYRDVMQEEWSASGYQRVRSGLRSRHVVGPVRRVKRDQAGRVTDEILVTRESDAWAPSLEEMEDRSKWCGWKRHFYDNWGRVTEVRVYHTIPSSGEGTSTDHYDKSTFFYDVRGRQMKSVDATGTITRTIYDVRGLVRETWVGTDDEGFTDTDPEGTGSNNMTKVSEREYDNDEDGGNGNLTRSTALTGESGNDRESRFEYDFRDQLVKSRAVEAKSGGTVTVAFLTEVERDGLGRAAVTYRYREETGEDPLLIAKSAAHFDSRGRAWKEESWGAHPVTGVQTEHALRSLRWFDAGGNVIKSAGPGSDARKKLIYDGLDRTRARYIVLEDEEPPPGSGSESSSGSSSSSDSSSSDSSSSDSVSGSFSSPSSVSDEPEPDDEKDPPGSGGEPLWPINRPSSSDDQILIPHNKDDTIRGSFFALNMALVVETADKTCPNCCEEDEEGGATSTGGGASTKGVSDSDSCGETSDGEQGPCPVHYATGQKSLAFTDLSLPGHASAWGHTRVVNNRGAATVGGAHGPGITIRQQPALMPHPSGRIAFVGGGTRNVFFDEPTSGTFRASFGGNRAQLSRQAATEQTGEQFTFTTRSGAQRIFHGHDSSVLAVLHGQLKQVVTRSGQAFTPQYSTGGALVRMTLPASAGTRRAQFTYDYYPNDVGTEGGNAGRLHTVELEMGPQDAPEERRRVRYDYYSGGSGDHGADGDLRLVSHEEWDGDNWVAVRCEYFRYYKAAHSDAAGLRGNAHRMKYVVGPAGCAALGDPSGYDSKTDAEILSVSRYFFEYDEDDRVFREYMNGGKLMHEFTYAQTEVDPEPQFTGWYDELNEILNANVWFTRTTETVYDTSGVSPVALSAKVVYTNRMGKVILSTLHEYAGGTATGKVWHTYNVFDSEGRFIRRASPSAVDRVEAPEPPDEILLVHLHNDAGLIRDIQYYPEGTTAGTGEVEGLISTESVREGTGGTGFITSRYRYGTRTDASGISIHPLVYEAHYAAAAESSTGALITYTKFNYHGESANTYVGSFPVTPQESEFPTANDVSQDTVFLQQKNTFDAGGNVIFTRVWQRFHDATLKGELNGPTGDSPRGRCSYAAFYPDPLGRLWLTADFGTNSGQPLSRPALCPSLVTHNGDQMKLIKTTRTRYNARGEAFQFTDPNGIITEWTNDCAGRRTQLIENVTTLTGPDRNRITNFTYLPGGLLDEMSIPNADTGNTPQVTKWFYGTTKDTGSPATGSLIATNHLLRRKKYATDTGDDYLHWHYNQLGEVRRQKDANGTLREFTRDRLGRLTSDEVLDPGSGVASSVMRLGREYNKQGRLRTATSYDDGNGVFNQVGFDYNAFGQMAADRQDHDDVVDWNTPANTPSVLYAYADGSANHLRLTGITYPDGRLLEPGYNTAGSYDDRLSRPRQLQFTNDADPAVQYLYAGLSWIVEAAYPEPKIFMTQHNLGGVTVGDGGDQYLAIDRFGRLQNVRWHRMDASDPEDASAFIEKLTFGYDKADNRTWRLNHLQGTTHTHDEHYLYDGLYQVKGRKRGHLNDDHTAISGTPTRQEDFTYDPLGNWNNYTAIIPGEPTFDQDRTHNKSNQITALDGSSTLVAHDKNGNMTKTAPDKTGDWSKGYGLVWDAWNRLVQVHQLESPFTVVADYQYDALFRRIIRTVDSVHHHEYWDAAWRLIEERTGSAATPAFQYLWGLQRRNDLVLRDTAAAIGGSESSSYSSSGETARLYAAYDWINPTAILTREGEVLGRQTFSAFGVRAIILENWDEDETVPELADWNFAFHGQFADPETGWLNYGFRYYNAFVGRWTRRDDVDDRASIGRWAFVGNNSVTYRDSLGLITIPVDDAEFYNFQIGETVYDDDGKINTTESRRKLEQKKGKTKFSTTVDEENCKAVITIPIHFRADPTEIGVTAVTETEIAKLVTLYNEGISEAWDRYKLCCSKCCADGIPISVTISPAGEDTGQTVYISQTRTSHQYNFPANKWQNYLDGDGISVQAVAAHEIGHFLGNIDEYGTFGNASLSEGEGKTTETFQPYGQYAPQSATIRFTENPGSTGQESPPSILRHPIGKAHKRHFWRFEKSLRDFENKLGKCSLKLRTEKCPQTQTP